MQKNPNQLIHDVHEIWFQNYDSAFQFITPLPPQKKKFLFFLLFFLFKFLPFEYSFSLKQEMLMELKFLKFCKKDRSFKFMENYEKR